MEKWYKGISGSGLNLITVIASTDQEAKEEVRKSLSKPGRYQILERWEKDGEQVKEVTLSDL